MNIFVNKKQYRDLSISMKLLNIILFVRKKIEWKNIKSYILG